ncbi:MAG: DUF4143 domain-containing protein [Deltaproteobacteria bacterium]|nr:DUF4143 domain-containing protein [Deltaproteobacteria bacterium]
MGLAAYLAGWRESEMLRLGPMGGAAFETHVFGNILGSFRHQAREVEIHFWRTRDGQEIDFLVEARGKVCPVEVKMGSPNPQELLNIEKIAEPNWISGKVVSLTARDNQPLAKNWELVGPWNLGF